MSFSEHFVAELDAEMTTSRRLLERVPSDKGSWKPHEKSFPLGHLAQLVATMPGWITSMARGKDIDLSNYPGYSFQKTESLVEQFDRHVAEARAALSDFKDSDYTLPWSLRRGEQVFMTDQRGTMIRQTINHFCHHRGQLTVYLRLLDVPIPSIYGPTADERGF